MDITHISHEEDVLNAFRAHKKATPLSDPMSQSSATKGLCVLSHHNTFDKFRQEEPHTARLSLNAAAY